MSLFDVAINTEGTALESMSGRTIMSSLHGMFSVGGMFGASVGAPCWRAAWRRRCISHWQRQSARWC